MGQLGAATVHQGGVTMRTLVWGLFSLVLIGSATLLTTTDALAGPTGYTRGTVPIPDTLGLFAAGFAGLIAWRVISRRKPA